MTSLPEFDWNDLRFFIAIAHTGSTIAAGKALGVSQSTVHRRMSALESALDRKLVTRHPTGYRLTEDGEALLPYAIGVDDRAQEIARHLADTARDISGVIRVTCPEPIVLRIANSQLLDRFHARHPRLRIEFLMSDRYLDIAKGEADVAFRSGDTDGDLTGRKVADSLWAVYASPAYLERHGRPARLEDLSGHRIVAFSDALSAHRTSVWLKEIAPGAEIVAQNNSVLGLVSAVKSGIGLGPLPTALGDAEAGLVRVFGPIKALTRSWKLLTHPNLRRIPRIAAFFDFIEEERAALKAILTG